MIDTKLETLREKGTWELVNPLEGAIPLVEHKVEENGKGTNRAPRRITVGKDKVVIRLSFLEWKQTPARVHTQAAVP